MDLLSNVSSKVAYLHYPSNERCKHSNVPSQSAYNQMGYVDGRIVRSSGCTRLFYVAMSNRKPSLKQMEKQETTLEAAF